MLGRVALDPSLIKIGIVGTGSSSSSFSVFRTLSSSVGSWVASFSLSRACGHGHRFCLRGSFGSSSVVPPGGLSQWALGGSECVHGNAVGSFFTPYFIEYQVTDTSKIPMSRMPLEQRGSDGNGGTGTGAGADDGLMCTSCS